MYSQASHMQFSNPRNLGEVIYIYAYCIVTRIAQRELKVLSMCYLLWYEPDLHTNFCMLVCN